MNATMATLNLTANDLPDIPIIEEQAEPIPSLGRTGGSQRKNRQEDNRSPSAPPRIRGGQQRIIKEQVTSGSLSIGGSNCSGYDSGPNRNLEENTFDTSEPKITPSISNIGSALLRSKTADFERLLIMKNKNKPTSIDCSEVTFVGNTKESLQLPPSVYKRNEIIASVQTNKK